MSFIPPMEDFAHIQTEGFGYGNYRKFTIRDVARTIYGNDPMMCRVEYAGDFRCSCPDEYNQGEVYTCRHIDYMFRGLNALPIYQARQVLGDEPGTSFDVGEMPVFMGKLYRASMLYQGRRADARVYAEPSPTGLAPENISLEGRLPNGKMFRVRRVNSERSADLYFVQTEMRPGEEYRVREVDLGNRGSKLVCNCSSGKSCEHIFATQEARGYWVRSGQIRVRPPTLVYQDELVDPSDSAVYASMAQGVITFNGRVINNSYRTYRSGSDWKATGEVEFQASDLEGLKKIAKEMKAEKAKKEKKQDPPKPKNIFTEFEI